MVTGGAWVVLSYTCVQCDAKWRPVLVLAAVAVEPIKIRRLNGARTEDCVTSGHSIEAAGRYIATLC